MDKDWILQSKDTRRVFANATWVPLRASVEHSKGDVKAVPYESEYFGCGSVAFPPQHRERAESLGWSDIGISRSARPHAYEDGHYSSIEEYQYNDKEPIGIHLVFDHPHPVVGAKRWILSPDLVVALGLIKEGPNWVRPEEDFAIVAREVLDEDGDHKLIEIKREFLIDYLAARGLCLRLSYYRQRVENVADLDSSPYAGLESRTEPRDGGRFELLVRKVNDVFGGSWAVFRMWRTDVDEEEDAPVMGPERDDNTEFESSRGRRDGFGGVRVEGEFWREEWIEHQGRSVRVRGDEDQTLPTFIVETDGKRLPSAELNNEDVGRWLWFRPSVVSELLSRRGFSLEWYTAETGAIRSTSGVRVHFGINAAELITVYAHDVARVAPWEQHIWAAHNVAPEGKVSAELLESQVKAEPASTHAPEELLLEVMRMLESGFNRHFGARLFTHDIDDREVLKIISRFVSKDRASLLRLAKELVRVFTDRLDVRTLRQLSNHPKKNELKSNKLLESILADRVGQERARHVFRAIAGAYDMRVGDAHPTSSSIGDAMHLAGLNESDSYLKQGERLISHFGEAIWWIGRLLFADREAPSA